MTKKPLSSDEPTAPYQAPVLVKYGALFVETAATPCSDPHTDMGNDNCDPDGGNVDGPK
jgi:hypothetical protein